MNKLAFLFSGQGAQKQGMAQDLADKYPIVARTFAESSEILGYDLATLINADDGRLNETQFTQPAILTTSIALYRLIIAETDLRPDAVAGLSLGEYSALVAAGALDFATAVSLVAQRGALMSQMQSGKMVAILGTDTALIEEACGEASSLGIVSPANYNTPAQTVIGGETQAVDKALELLQAAGSKKQIELKVSGPFHTALMAPAAAEFAKILETTAFHDFNVPLVSNTTGKIMAQDEIRTLLTRQMQEPVRWVDSIQTMTKNLGITRFIEVGPGKVLSGFVKKIAPEASDISNVEDFESFRKLVNA
ncbi:MAG: ACP S-malonyltransferase [Streptococcaceae bacterium]|jgi:[acyl-carrier-protein] S-malonyltransferase|nr:ACP S-malonyltransferase [Streptococcaceae bacterium]